jgi:Holliday junction DNA helicase RuvA
MIAQLRGKIVSYNPRFIILMVMGVGYKVFVTADILNKINKDEQNDITFWTYLAVRDDSLDLYGFLSQAELNFFELLITISGVGPKTAQGILNVASVHTLQTAISSKDTSHLTKISGLGKKMAEKIVLELRDKIDHIETSEEHGLSMKNESDALEALKSLGYSHTEAREALQEIDKKITKTNDKIKEALKILGK